MLKFICKQLFEGIRLAVLGNINYFVFNQLT